MYVPEYGRVHVSTGACGDQRHQRSLELQVINKPPCVGSQTSFKNSQSSDPRAISSIPRYTDF